MMNKTRVLFLVLLLGPVLTGSVNAEVVILKNGQQISGQIVGQSRSAVQVRTAGGTQTIDKGAVRRIVYGATLEEKKQDEDRRKKQEVLQKKQQEELLKQQQELIKKQQDEFLKKQEEDQKRLLDDAARAEAERRAAAARAAAAAEPEDDSITLSGALWRSAVLPGWGQAYQGRTGAAIGFAAAAVGLAGATGGAYQDYWIQRANYRRAADAFLYTSPFMLDQVSQTLPTGGSTTENLSLYMLGQASGTQFGVEKYIARGDAAVTGMFFYEFRNSSLSASDREKLFVLNNLATSARQRTNMKRAAYNLNAAATALGAVYAWNLVDVAVFGPGSGALSLMVLPGQYGFAYGTTF